ncbi:2-hydroxychromene-2-carboxylate isomerase [Sulfitobacter albidus]|uniref:2-hydroxychromene-2-carboxylate isomerase n=1 Tax=Sulfitobacter albidus TaxID=2829501 RepID=A0A975JBG4_9RHOB|nr:2-hydroxychromene-2-carboxylate isomerase [Sulfitobacter albidus]QUJ75361.1 2-hydroxychromene-2-carboxylate isomerase [Sulfitobacter albidus]
MVRPQIEYFYSAHSAYAYLGARRLSQIADEAGWEIVHRPFDFLPVVAAAGGPPLAKRTQGHIDYFFGRELVRWAHWRDQPILRHRPTHHDNALAPASGMILASPDPTPLSAAILRAHWVDDADIADRATLIAIADEAGQDGGALFATGQSAPVQAQFAANTAEACARCVPGSPTYFVRGDMFYGQDRLEMIKFALGTPFPD